MRIPPSATTAPLAAQSSAQPVASGDSFAVILGAASVSPSSVRPVVAPAVREQTGQGSANRKADKQAEGQAPLVQSGQSTRTSTARLSSDRTESAIEQTASDKKNLNRTSDRSTTVAPGRNLSVAPKGAPAFRENANAISDPTIPQPIQISAPDAEKAPGQEIGQSSDGGSSAASARTENLTTAAASHAAPQSSAAQSMTKETALEQGESAQDMQTMTGPVDTGADADSSALTDQNGLPTVAAGALESDAAQMLQQSMALPNSEMTPPNPAGVPSKGPGVEPAGNATPTSDSTSARPTNSDLAGIASSGITKPKDGSSSPGDVPVHSIQNAQGDPLQNAASTTKVQDIAAIHPQVQTMVSTAVTHETVVAPRGSDVPATASHPGAAREAEPAIDPEGLEAMPASSGVNAARLVQAMSESEMHIGLSSSGFGDISIRTSISNHQMLAQISLDHSELSQAISAHVSSVQAKLSDDYGLRASIEVNHPPSSHSGEPGNSSQKERGAAAASLPSESIAAQGDEKSGMGQEAMAIAGDESRLDIRA